MLFLTRKSHERLLIGDDIIIEVVEIDRGRVKVGIIAPPHVRVDREEVRERKDGNCGEKGGSGR